MSYYSQFVFIGDAIVQSDDNKVKEVQSRGNRIRNIHVFQSLGNSLLKASNVRSFSAEKSNVIFFNAACNATADNRKLADYFC